ncbi:MarR family winged helix-turn-helix transcriptional regulator [Pseudonocardia nigra]|uniref:MarR family winged helix-turn-helix transcriptional regulator n=1 Tax=Pseudonocardia nigra TaxID=1921578 RepID=UPI001C5F2531|nr:MarR family winged helix-turn-helix transcriptional regulator [Pseudonocardia nigra]
MPSIAAALALSRQFVQCSVDAAAGRGWVRSTPNPAHRRSVLIELTPDGAATMAAITAREHAVLRDVGGELTDADVEACLHVLRHLHAAVADVAV